MDRETILHRAEEAHLRLVRFMYCDNGGIIRGKATHINGLKTRMTEGIGQSLAMQAFAGVDALAAVPGMGPVGEFRLVPDPDTFVVLPYAPKTGMMLCDLYSQHDHQPWSACPRTFLKRVIAAAEEMGIIVQAAVEHEFYLAHVSGAGDYTPFDRSLCYSSIGFDTAAPIIDDILATLEQEGIQVEQYMPELGPGQQELSIQRADALRAADNVLLVRETVRGVAQQHGAFASFAAKPFLDQAGSGAHIHFSLWGMPGTPTAGKNLLYDPQGTGEISQLGYSFIGGVLAHLPALLALTCASPNSYRRLLPRFWSSAYTTYGFDNRESAIRIPSTFWGREAESTNFELKPADHSGNPYLALGALIAVGLDGIRQQLHPGPPVDVDPDTLSENERQQRHIRRLPATLDEALDALEQDRVLTDALGSLETTAYLAVKRLECQHFADKSPEEEARQHFYKY
ncbi:MAG TPA: glutamine synthetase family protein [Ktedonobacterales bacterium]